MVKQCGCGWLMRGHILSDPPALFMTKMRRFSRVALNIIKCCFCIYHAHIDPNKMEYLSLFLTTFHQAFIVKPVLMTNTGGKTKKEYHAGASVSRQPWQQSSFVLLSERKKIICLIELRNFRRLTTPTPFSSVWRWRRSSECKTKVTADRREWREQNGHNACMPDMGDLCTSEAFNNKINSKSMYVMAAGA